MNQKPILTQINNGIITATNAMPLKDITSNNEADFSMSRRLFNKSFFNNSAATNNQPGTSVIQRESLALSSKVVIAGGKSVAQKKWIGGNRDASSIISRRKVSNTGSIQTVSNAGSTAFTNIRDTNTAREALIRCRSGGYRVPPRVTQKNIYPILPIPIPTYYRVISNGFNYYATREYIITTGLYEYTPEDLSGTAIMSAGSENIGRSYNLATINRSTGEVTVYPIFDVFGSVSRANALVNTLNALDNSVIVIIMGSDEPRANSNLLVAAFQRCGASSDFNLNVNYRSAYALIGIPGMGINNGLERQFGLAPNPPTIPSGGDPDALVDIRISILDGDYTYISG